MEAKNSGPHFQEGLGAGGGGGGMNKKEKKLFAGWVVGSCMRYFLMVSPALYSQRSSAEDEH